MPKPFSEQDFIALSAYLDEELSGRERTAFEQRLADDPDLRAELDSMRVLVSVLAQAERLRAPRRFTLDPTQYGRPARPAWWLSIPALAGAAVSMLAVAVYAGLFLLGGAGLGGLAAAPVMGQFAVGEAATEEAEEALEAEAPADSQPQADQAASSAPLSTPTPSLAPTMTAAAFAPEVQATQPALPEAGGAPAGGSGNVIASPTAVATQPPPTLGVDDSSRTEVTPQAGAESGGVTPSGEEADQPPQPVQERQTQLVTPRVFLIGVIVVAGLGFVLALAGLVMAVTRRR